MAIKTYNPLTGGMRNLTTLSTNDLTKKAPEKSLLKHHNPSHRWRKQENVSCHRLQESR